MITDHYSQAERMIRSGHVSADAAAVVHAVLAVAQAFTAECDCFGAEDPRPVVDAKLTGDLL